MSAIAACGWDAFSALTHPALGVIPLETLIILRDYRQAERIAACDGADPVGVCVAYAQDSLIYDAEGRMAEADTALYAATPEDARVNKFGLAYRSDAPLLLHRALADIVIDAAIALYREYRWKTVVFDGLRTVEGAYNMHRNTGFKWLANGLLAAPGESAHNRALAVDCMLFDAMSREVDMGAHFDHSDMAINHRNYAGDSISEAAKTNRIIRERAMQRAAIQRGTALAPLRPEFWDDRMPGTERDLWRVLESLCRCLGEPFFDTRAEDYDTFASQWLSLPREKMRQLFGEESLTPPAHHAIIFHEKLNPIYDRDLPPAFRQTPGE